MTAMKVLCPPENVRCMTVLDREAFTKQIKIITVTISLQSSKMLLPKLKKYMLKVPNFKGFQKGEGDDLELYLNPDLISSEEQASKTVTEMFPGFQVGIRSKIIELTYKNWTKDDIFGAVLPDNAPGVASYTGVGHIMHLNLREHVLPYKYLIAQVLLDKSPKYTLVVNKTDIIDKSDNQFRSFRMETLSGTGGTVTTLKENGCSFSFDFSKVYWNSRLSTEHKRIIDMVTQGDVLFDVMAGVGPFSVPCAKKIRNVYANDMNPHSYQWLVKNSETAKVADSLHSYNMDGKDFINSIVREKLGEIYSDASFKSTIHFTMNLPSIAPEFLSSFYGLLNEKPGLREVVKENPPTVHCYMFTFNFCRDYAINRVAFPLGFCHKDLEIPSLTESELSPEILAKNILPDFSSHVIEVHDVRRVSTNKGMVRISFRLPSEVLFKLEDDSTNPPYKKRKCDFID